ncbi:MAG TPA: hypothetical protein VFG63_16660 [Nocardioidaceae bacterium]|nr:hypothetical protein [Nocardioidaceae bacterium]
MSNHHKKPTMVFILLVVLAAAVVGNQLRAGAELSRFIAAGPISAHSTGAHGIIAVEDGAPAVPDAPAATPDRNRTDRLPAAAVIYDHATVVSAPAVGAHGAPHQPGSTVDTPQERPAAEPGPAATAAAQSETRANRQHPAAARADRGQDTRRAAHRNVHASGHATGHLNGHAKAALNRARQRQARFAHRGGALAPGLLRKVSGVLPGNGQQHGHGHGHRHGHGHGGSRG